MMEMKTNFAPVSYENWPSYSLLVAFPPVSIVSSYGFTDPYSVNDWREPIRSPIRALFSFQLPSLHDFIPQILASLTFLNYKLSQISRPYLCFPSLYCGLKTWGSQIWHLEG